MALTSESLEVTTRLAKAEYDAMVLRGPLETQRERLNQLIGRDVGVAFEVSPLADTSWEEMDLAAARRPPLERRPEVPETALTLKQAEADRCIEKSDTARTSFQFQLLLAGQLRTGYPEPHRRRRSAA